MEINNNLPKAEKENQPSSILKRVINNFLISYFDYLALAIAFIVFAAGLFWFVYPQYKSITEGNNVAKKNLQAEYAAKDNDLRTISDLKKWYQQIGEADRKKIEAMVPVDDNVIGLIPKIESIILSNSAILNSIKIESVDSPGQAKVEIDSVETPESLEGVFSGPLPGGVKLVRIEISLGSVDYQVLKNIIKTLENSIRLFDVAKIDYSVSDSKVILIIYSYYLVN